MGVGTNQWVSVGSGVWVGAVAVAVGSGVGVRVGMAVGVRVGVRLGQRVSVGRVVWPVGVLVNECVGTAVRVGVTGVFVKGMVLVGKTFVAVGVGLAGFVDRLPLWL